MPIRGLAVSLLGGLVGAAQAAAGAPSAAWSFDLEPDPALAVRSSRVLQWSDSRGLPRRLWVAEQGIGRSPGFLARLDYGDPMASVRGSREHLGGVTEVMHLGRSKDGASAVAGLRDGKGAQQAVILEGPHHLRHRLRYRFEARPKPALPLDRIAVTRDLLFYPGRDELLYSVSFDFSALPEGQAVYDSRSPYQEWDWALNGYRDYSGFEAGGRGRLRVDAIQGGQGLAVRSDHDNRVPFLRSWDLRSDRATAMVATRLWQEQPMGQEAWAGSDEPILAPGERSLGGIPAWELPYQVGAYYQWTPKNAWQTYQRLGFKKVRALGRDWPAYPRYSYSVWLCLGRHSEGRAQALLSEVERSRECRLSARRGRVPAQGPRSIADDEPAAYPVPGLDPVLGAWRAEADSGGRVDLALDLKGPFQAPLLVISGLKADGVARLNGGEAGLRISRGTDGLTWVSLEGSRQGLQRLEWR